MMRRYLPKVIGILFLTLAYTPSSLAVQKQSFGRTLQKSIKSNIIGSPVGKNYETRKKAYSAVKGAGRTVRGTAKVIGGTVVQTVGQRIDGSQRKLEKKGDKMINSGVKDFRKVKAAVTNDPYSAYSH